MIRPTAGIALSAPGEGSFLLER